MSLSAGRRLGQRYSARSTAWRQLVLPQNASLPHHVPRSATPSGSSTTSASLNRSRQAWSLWPVNFRRSRPLHTSVWRSAEEVPTMPLENEIMTMLDKNPEFRDITFAFANRIREVLGIDIQNGQMPSPRDLMTVAQDSEIRSLSTRIMKLMQDSNIVISEDSVKMLYNMLMNAAPQK